jgi:hypothetical protein
MSDRALTSLPAPGPFQRRAGKVVSNAALFQLVEELAGAVDRMDERLDQIHGLCTTILARLT